MVTNHHSLRTYSPMVLWIDFNHSLKYPAPLTYEAKGKILRFKVWLKMWLMPSCKPLPISIDLLKERWSSIPDA